MGLFSARPACPNAGKFMNVRIFYSGNYQHREANASAASLPVPNPAKDLIRKKEIFHAEESGAPAAAQKAH